MGNYKGGISSHSAVRKHGNKQIMSETIANPVKFLSDIYSWAEQSLIQDILAAVNNDVDQASNLLSAMVSKDAKLRKPSLSGARSSTATYHCDSKNKFSGEGGSVENKSRGSHQVLTSTQFSVPVEPEREENDVYLSHRKDAIKMMRMASEHSRAARNAYLRGDHVSAQHHSSRAREGRTGAQKLNAEAASEILHTKNINNNAWKLDLHGLHAKEAVSALKDHLHKIESQTARRRRFSANKLIAALKALCCLDTDIKTEEDNVMDNQLEVITGRGRHSRGRAVLPDAVRSFLIENGYRFEDVRPGVIGVRPKFRHK